MDLIQSRAIKKLNRSVQMKVVLFCLAFLMGGLAHAQQYGIVAGLNSSKFKTSGASSTTWDRKIGLNVGGQFLFPINESIELRTGGTFIQKTSSITSGSVTVDFTLTYLEIPLTVIFNVNETVGIIAGLNLDLKLSDSCSGTNVVSCKINSPKSMSYGATVGGRFNISGPHAIEALFEMGLADIFNQTKLDNNINIQYAYKFD